MEDMFKGSIIDKDQHDMEIKKETTWLSETVDENPIPKSVVRLEKLYDLQDKFKMVTNFKIQLYNAVWSDQPRNYR